MPRINLAIRDPYFPDHLSVHDTETEARAELAAYVRRQSYQGGAVQILDDAATDAWFDNRHAHCAIGEVTTSLTTGAPL